MKNLGVTLDCNLNMTQHVLSICRSAYIELRQIGCIRHLLTVQATQTLVCAFILSRSDYCSCLLAGCARFLIDRLQKVQNAAARLICRAKNLTMSNPFFTRYTGFQLGHEYLQNLHALLQCNYRHWTTIPLRSSPSLHSL